MPRAKSTKYYPTEFFVIAEKIGKMLSGAITMQLATEKQAKSIQGRYYAFLGALKREVEAGPLNKTTEEQANWHYKNELLPFAHKVYITTNGAGEVTFQHRSESWYAKALAKALGDLGVPSKLTGIPSLDVRPGKETEADSAEVLASIARMQRLAETGGSAGGPRADYAELKARLKRSGDLEVPQEPIPTPIIKE